MAGISDIRHELCLGLSLWNGADPILKERMFGLTGPQGNHGEDVKEYWWYLEGLPSHACCAGATTTRRRAFPYQRAGRGERPRGREDLEFELLDTGVFDDDRYWSVEVTYAKASPTEVLAQHHRREPRPRRGDARRAADPVVPQHVAVATRTGRAASLRDAATPSSSSDHRLAGYRLEAAPGPDGSRPEALFCDNETNTPRVCTARRR